MKKTILGIGISLIIILAGVWAYLLFFNTSSSNTDVFSLFNFGDTTDTSIALEDLPIVSDEDVVVDVTSAEALRQLTIRPVIGQQEVQLTASSSPLVYFVEAGTGHVYSIDLVSGEEIRISNITVPNARTAAISTDGVYAVIKSGDGASGKLSIITLPTDTTELTSTTLEASVSSFSITTDDELLFASQTSEGTAAKVYNLLSNTTRSLFQIPFRETVIDWGGTADASHFIYPKASARLQGFLYKVTGSVFERLPASGYGLSARSNETHSLYSIQKDGEYQTYVVNPEESTTPIYPALLPEKCVLSTPTIDKAVCAISTAAQMSNFPDAWYQGDIETKDSLWFIRLSSGEIGFLTDTYSETSREIDISNETLNEDASRLLFINRTDHTLWAYDILWKSDSTEANLVE